MMNRREMLLDTGAALVGLSAFPLRWAAGADDKKKKILYFTLSYGFEHTPVARKGNDLSFSEKLMVEEGQKHGLEVVCSKDGTLFDGDIGQFDAFAFYTCGNLTKPDGKHEGKPLSENGKKRLLDAVRGGKGFVAFHSGADTFHSKGPADENQDELDPYVAMVGGEFIVHGSQQKAKMGLTSPKFPGCDGLGDGFEVLEEWYALKNFAKDLHVILVQETAGMHDWCYQRPPFPATWARPYGKGRVFYTSLGHREDIWTNPLCQQVILGGFSWVLKHEDADVTPNIEKVTPKAWDLPKRPQENKPKGK
jgi:type 1 glutamine amidotransferase